MILNKDRINKLIDIFLFVLFKISFKKAKKLKPLGALA